MLKLLLISYDSKTKETICIYEKQYELRFKKKPLQILSEMCLQNGCTMEGRMSAFCYLTNAKQKPAILISERTQLIYFPTTSRFKEECYWILYNEILHLNTHEGYQTKVKFFDGTEVIVPFDRRILKKQMDRCTVFLDKLNDFENVGKKYTYR